MAPKKFGMTKRESDARRASASIKRSLPKKSTWTMPKQPTITTRKESADVVATSRYGTKFKPQAPGASKSVLQRIDEIGGGAADFIFPEKTAGKIVNRQALDAEDYLALASLLPIPGVKAAGKGAQAISKGAKALANPAPAYAATKATLPKAAKATAENPWAGKPRQITAMVNKQRRADLAKIEAKNGTASPKTGAGSANAAPKQGPKKSPPTVPPTKGVTIKTDDTPKLGQKFVAKKPVPEQYRSTRSTNVAGETIKPFDAPKPQYQQFKVNGQYGEAEKAKFKAAMKEWKRKSKAAEKKATTAPAEQRTGTPLEKMREDVTRARFAQAGGSVTDAAKIKGSTEANIQSTALKEAADAARARGDETARMMQDVPGAKTNKRQPVRDPKEGTRGGKGYNSRKGKLTTRPAKIRVAPKRENFTTDAKYNTAKGRYDKAIADARAKADAKQATAKPGTDTPTTRTGNVAPEIAPKAPSRKGGFKETGFRFRFEGKTGKAGEPKMTKRPKLTDEAYVGEASVKANKQFQGIRPGKEVPEYRNVIDNLPDAKPAPKAAAAPKKQSAKSKAGTKPAETKPAETSTAPASAAPKTSNKAKVTKEEPLPERPADSKFKSRETPASNRGVFKNKAGARYVADVKAQKALDNLAQPKAAAKPAKPAAEAKPAETPAAPAAKTPSAEKPKPAEAPKAEKAPKAPKTPSAKDKKAKKPTAPELADRVFKRRPPKSDRAKARAAKREAKGPGPIKRFGQTKPMRITKTGAATVAAASGVGALAVGGTRATKPVSTPSKKTYQAGEGNGRLSRLTIRKAQADRATAAAETPSKKFGAAGESKFLKGRSAVRQSVIDQINKQGMAKSLAAVKSRQNDPEYIEAIRRFYGAKRLKQALKG